jgi:hypothetical protein
MAIPRDPTNDGCDVALTGIVEAQGMTMKIAHDHAGPRLSHMPDGRYRWEDAKALRACSSAPDGVAGVVTRLVTNEETGISRRVEGVPAFDKTAARSAGTTSFSAGTLANHETFTDPRAHVPPFSPTSCKDSQMPWERLADPDVETTRICRRGD